MTIRAVKLAGCMLLLAACEGTTDSQVAGTSGVAPSALRFLGTVRSNGNVAQIETTLYDTELRALDGGDSLVLSAADGASRTLEASGDAYYAQITTPSTSLTLELVRGDASRHAATLTLPPAFTIAAPSATSRSAAMVATWPAEPSFAVSVEVSAVPAACTAGWTRTYPSDPGTFTLQVADFASVPGTCVVTVQVRRQVMAAATGELAVGTLQLQQVRTLVLETQP